MPPGECPPSRSVGHCPIGRGSQAVGPRTSSSRRDVVPTARGPRWPLQHGLCRRLAGRLCGTLGFGLVSLAGRVNRPAHLVAGQPHTQAWRGTSYLILPNALGFRPPEASPGSQCLPVRSLGTSGSSSSLSPLLSGVRGLPGGSWAGGRGRLLDPERGLGRKVAGPEPHTCRKSPRGGECLWQACLPDAVWLAVGGAVLPRGSH